MVRLCPENICNWCMKSLTVLVIGLLASCASAPPPEFVIYQQTFGEAREATTIVLSAFGPYERAARTPPKLETFNPDDARYIAGDAQPGLAEQIDRGFTALNTYNQVLARYAGGESIETIKPQIGVFAKQASLAANLVVPGASTAIAAGTKLLDEVAGAILAVSDRAEFARAVSENSPKILTFISAAREASSIMYATAYNEIGKQNDKAIKDALDADQVTQARQLQTETNRNRSNFRVLLARWVLLLDDLHEAVGALQIAVAEGQDSLLTAAQLDFWSNELRDRAESIKESAIAFRATL